jgi:hypothetical protein
MHSNFQRKSKEKERERDDLKIFFFFIYIIHSFSILKIKLSGFLIKNIISILLNYKHT